MKEKLDEIIFLLKSCLNFCFGDYVENCEPINNFKVCMVCKKFKEVMKMADLTMSKDKIDYSQKPDFINKNTVDAGKGGSTPVVPRNDNGSKKVG